MIRVNGTVGYADFDWDCHRAHWDAWWAGELERPLLEIALQQPLPAGQALPPGVLGHRATRYSDAELVAQEDLRQRHTRHFADSFPKLFLNFGPGIVAGFLGAHVRTSVNTVWFEPKHERPIAELHPAPEPTDPWWPRLQGLIRALNARWGGRVAIAHTDLGGNLDILASLRTTEGLLMDLMDAPADVARCAAVITREWLRYYDASERLIREACPGCTPWGYIWSSQTCYMLQSDFAYMIGPAMFEQFVLPDLHACCAHMEHGFYHLDGIGQLPHLDALCALERLRGIQWIPGDGQPPPSEWPDVLKRIRDAGKLCQTYATPEQALAICRTFDGGKGFALQVHGLRDETEIGDFLAEVGRSGRWPSSSRT